MSAMDFCIRSDLGATNRRHPVPGILRLCNYLQNVGATTCILGLQLSTFIFYNKHLFTTLPHLFLIISSLPSSYPIPFHLPKKENWKYGMKRRKETKEEKEIKEDKNTTKHNNKRSAGMGF